MKRRIWISLFCGLLAVQALVASPTETPYTEVVELQQIASAETERVRMVQSLRKFDAQPTGFYLREGKKLTLHVEQIAPATDGSAPAVIVGTPGHIGNASKTIPLALGVNEINPSQHSGGLIYLKYTSEKENPQGNAKVTFTATSEHEQAPQYIFGTTTKAEFTNMLSQYNTPDVVFHSDYLVVVATREATYTYPLREDMNKWLAGIHTLLEKEDEISGMDNADPNPIHHRQKAGEVRYLFVQTTSTSPHATQGYTAYPAGAVSRYLTYDGSYERPWMMAHEVGHQHQQSAYKVDKSTESTVNLYPYYFMKYKDGESYNRTTATRWATAQSTYLALPLEERIYNMPDKELEAIVGFNRDELRFMPWEQLFILFGYDFYKNLHRVTREEKATGVSAEQDKRFYLIWKASHVSGYDLREFFNQWGIRVTDAEVLAQMNDKFEAALNKGVVTLLPYPIADVIGVTGQDIPAWAPLQLRGVTSSRPAGNIPLDRTGWTVTTPYPGPSDGDVGGTDPNYIVDGDRVTAFAFVKPGKSYGGITVPQDAEQYFIIDMQETQVFDCVTYRHRDYGNSSEWIRANQISIFGSNDLSEFTPISDHLTIPTNAADVAIRYPEDMSYRYIKVKFEDWNKSSGSTMQVSEFSVGNYVDDLDGAGSSIENASPKDKTPLVVYPNPAKKGDWLHIVSPEIGNQFEVEIKDIYGRTVLSSDTFEVCTGSLSSGLYLVVLKDMETGKLHGSAKVLIQ